MTSRFQWQSPWNQILSHAPMGKLRLENAQVMTFDIESFSSAEASL